MWKKIVLGISFIVLITMGIFLFNYLKQNKIKQDSNEFDIVKDETNISSEYVTDDCVNEWAEYTEVVEKEIKETSNSINNEEKKYILIAEDGVLKVYYVNENNEKILYRVTDISIEYLEKEDIEKLEKGIEISGLEGIMELLEDFE